MAAIWLRFEVIAGHIRARPSRPSRLLLTRLAADSDGKDGRVGLWWRSTQARLLRLFTPARNFRSSVGAAWEARSDGEVLMACVLLVGCRLLVLLPATLQPIMPPIFWRDTVWSLSLAGPMAPVA